MNHREATIIGKYLLGKPPENKLINRYNKACISLKLDKETSSDKLTSMALRYPYLLPYFDAALAMQKEKKLLRKKILVMMAILETSTEHYEIFSSKNYSMLNWIQLFLKVIKAIIKAVIGKILLLFFYE